MQKFHTLTNGDSPGITPERAVKECEQMASLANSIDAQTWYKLALEIKHESLLRPEFQK
jgi:hypothetical protein